MVDDQASLRQSSSISSWFQAKLVRLAKVSIVPTFTIFMKLWPIFGFSFGAVWIANLTRNGSCWLVSNLFYIQHADQGYEVTRAGQFCAGVSESSHRIFVLIIKQLTYQINRHLKQPNEVFNFCCVLLKIAVSFQFASSHSSKTMLLPGQLDRNLYDFNMLFHLCWHL